MSRTPMYDPMTSDARSSWLAGLTEACNKISGVLDMKVSTFENLTLPELYISEDDRFRIYQAPLGNKLWLSNPAPVIKKNGEVITPETDGFTIDYLGGSIAFEEAYTLTEWDVITADATYIIDGSNKINGLIENLESIEEEAGKNKGAFKDVTDLESAYPNATPGDFAIISSENAIYIWDDTAKEWVNANAKVDLTQYFTKEEIENLLNEKQDEILAKDIPSGSTESATDYFYAGDKTWVSLIAKIKSCALSGLVTNDTSQVEAADSLLVAIGKLQAQINSFIHPIVGNGAPTTETEGVVGQDYINTSNGDKYRMIAIENGAYVWQKYGTVSAINFEITLSASEWIGTFYQASDNRFDRNCTYIVGPSDNQREDYNEYGVVANDIKTMGVILFDAKETPESNLTIKICRLEGVAGGKVYNTGSGGGSTKDLVTVPGGAVLTMEDIFGSPPYKIEFTEEEQEGGSENYAKFLSVVIPNGRMRGDVDGDGRITQADADMILKYTVSAITLTDVEAWCADTNGDGQISGLDSTTLSQYIVGLRNSLPNWLDYYGNWTYVSAEGQEGCWTTDIAVPTLTSDMSAAIIVQEVWEPGMFFKAEVANGVIRLSSIRPPITDVPCTIIYGNGNGLATIYTQHFPTTEQIGAAKKPIIAEVKLQPKRWDEDNCQYIDVKGVLGATWTNQMIQVIPDPGSGDEYKSCGISHEPDTEYEDSIRFHAATIPTNALSVRVFITSLD